MYQRTHKDDMINKKPHSTPRNTKPHSSAPMISQSPRSLFSACGTVQRQDAAGIRNSMDNPIPKKSLFCAAMVSPFQDSTRENDVPELKPLPQAFPVVQRTLDPWVLGAAVTVLSIVFCKLLSSCKNASMPDNDTTTKSADEEPFTPTPEKSSSKTKESEGGKVGDCLYTAVNHAIGNADANEDAFRRLATEWLVNADQDIHGRIADYGGIDAIINVVSTPQAWTGDEGDLAPYVLALALDIQLNIHVAGRNAPYPFNVGGARIVDVYYYANHYTHTPTSHHRKKKRKKTTSIPKEITPVESISKTVSEMSIPEEIPDAYANIREQLRELETAISELSDDKAVSLRERIRRAIGMEDPRKAFLRLSGEVENYIQSKSKPQNKTTENPPLKSPETEPEITFTTGYKGGSVTKQKLGGGNKKGTFVGNMKGIHIHIVGDNTHLQIGGHQYKIRRISYKKNCEDALRALIHRNNRSLPGYNDCLRWLCNELDIDHTRFL